jgi:hypothetical protein
MVDLIFEKGSINVLVSTTRDISYSLCQCSPLISCSILITFQDVDDRMLFLLLYPRLVQSLAESWLWHHGTRRASLPRLSRYTTLTQQCSGGVALPCTASRLSTDLYPCWRHRSCPDIHGWIPPVVCCGRRNECRIPGS